MCLVLTHSWKPVSFSINYELDIDDIVPQATVIASGQNLMYLTLMKVLKLNVTRITSFKYNIN